MSDKKPVEIFLGRLQPLHNGHLGIIKSMKNPVVVLVKGGKSSLDKTRNPLSAEDQERLVKKAAPNAKVVIASTGYIPDILKQLNVTDAIVHAGTDRIREYKAQIQRANKDATPETKLNVDFEETVRKGSSVSSTIVRAAIRGGDKKVYQQHVPKQLWDEFDNLKELLKEETSMNIGNIKSFDEYLKEEEEKKANPFEKKEEGDKDEGDKGKDEEDKGDKKDKDEGDDD